MQRLTTRSIATAQAIRDRVPFKTSGALSAEAHDPHSLYLYEGRLNRDECATLHDDLRIGIDYVVWSYSTPIAWHLTNGEWYKVEQKFSITTTKHQGNLYLI